MCSSDDGKRHACLSVRPSVVVVCRLPGAGRHCEPFRLVVEAHRLSGLDCCREASRKEPVFCVGSYLAVAYFPGLAQTAAVRSLGRNPNRVWSPISPWPTRGLELSYSLPDGGGG